MAAEQHPTASGCPSRYRRRRPEWFGPGGDYTPLPAAGPKREHVVAFARGRDRDGITLAPRLPIRLGGRWDGTTLALPDRRWINELTGEQLAGGKVPVADLLRRFPVALLSRADG